MLLLLARGWIIPCCGGKTAGFIPVWGMSLLPLQQHAIAVVQNPYARLAFHLQNPAVPVACGPCSPRPRPGPPILDAFAGVNHTTASL